MFSMSRNVGAVDFAVSRAIMELSEQQQFLSNETIARYIQCERRTVARALKRLIAAGVVERRDGAFRLGGYRYVVKK